MAKTAKIILLLLIAVVVESNARSHYHQGGDSDNSSGSDSGDNSSSGDSDNSSGSDSGDKSSGEVNNNEDGKKNEPTLIPVVLPGGIHAFIPTTSGAGEEPSYIIIIQNGQPRLIKNPGILGNDDVSCIQSGSTVNLADFADVQQPMYTGSQLPTTLGNCGCMFQNSISVEEVPIAVPRPVPVAETVLVPETVAVPEQTLAWPYPCDNQENIINPTQPNINWEKLADLLSKLNSCPHKVKPHPPPVQKVHKHRRPHYTHEKDVVKTTPRPQPTPAPTTERVVVTVATQRTEPTTVPTTKPTVIENISKFHDYSSEEHRYRPERHHYHPREHDYSSEEYCSEEHEHRPEESESCSEEHYDRPEPAYKPKSCDHSCMGDVLNLLRKFPHECLHQPKEVSNLIILLHTVLIQGGQTQQFEPNLSFDDSENTVDVAKLSNVVQLLLHILDEHCEPNLKTLVAPEIDESSRGSLKMLLSFLANGLSSCQNTGNYQSHHQLLNFLSNYECGSCDYQNISGMDSNSDLLQLLANL